MRAIILKGFGGVENLVEAEIPVPEIRDNEVLVQVKAIGINPVDIKTRKGKSQADNIKVFNPVILGWDISGIIAGTGRSVTSFKKGDEVFGMVNFPGHGKAYAEYVAAPEAHLAPKPANVTHEEAAAASLAALTAWQIFREKIKLKKGDRILIHAAAGGVGHYAVQMAKLMGSYVAGTGSAGNRDFVMSLGASLYIDYVNEKFEEITANLDFVLDSIGGDYVDRSLKVLKPGGTIVTIPSGGSESNAGKASASGKKWSSFLVRSNGSDMKEISEFLKNGTLKSFISATFSFDEIQAAHLQIETGKTRGKIVVSL